MAFKVSVTTDMNIQKNMKKVRSDSFWKAAAKEWHRLITPYTPMDSGQLSQQVSIRPKEIEYTVPHAHYIYTGKEMGPSLPVIKHGEVVGFFSPKGERKQYTGKKLNFKKDKHPKATIKWDIAARPLQQPKLVRFMQKYVDSGRLNLNG